MRGYFVAIPTYWTHPGGEGPEEIVFDHPTPLDATGTLRRTLESLTPLAAAGVEVVVSVVAAATAPALEAAVERPGPGSHRVPAAPLPGEIVCGLASRHSSGLLPDPGADGVAAFAVPGRLRPDP